MLFNSLEFAVFLLLVLGVHAVLPHRARNRWLLVVSYLFYAAWDWRFLGLIVLSTLVDFGVGLGLAATDDRVRRRRLLLTSLVVNLGLLGVFKYAGFFAESLAELLGHLGLEVGPWVVDLVLPVGISFYTFQTLSYTIDVYRRELAPTRDLLDFALFVAFFPQLVAGPIERAGRLLPQIVRPRRITWEGYGSGSWLILRGTFKKVVVADNLAPLVDMVYGAPEVGTGPEVVLATWAFAFQIYCDFSGYTDVARGVARLLGFELMVNFRLPYFAANPSDFWRRWHISLSTWLRDYLYVPLGGNRGGVLGTARNLMLTMVLGGLWHGAALTFVVWGAYQGVLLVIHRALREPLARLRPAGGVAAVVWRVLSIVVMFQLACLGWMIFRAETLTDVGTLLSAIVQRGELRLVEAWALPFCALVGPLLVMQFLEARRGDLAVVLRWSVPVRALVYAGVMWAVILLGEDFGQPFLYFQF